MDNRYRPTVSVSNCAQLKTLYLHAMRSVSQPVHPVYSGASRPDLRELISEKTEMTKELGLRSWALMAPREDIYTQAAFTVCMLTLGGVALALIGERCWGSINW